MCPARLLVRRAPWSLAWLNIYRFGAQKAHNHPSGAAEPSRADEYLTQTLKTALQMVDVRVLDHLVVTANVVVSFAERGLL